LDKYTYVYVVCAKITLKEQIIREADTPDKVKDMGWKILCEVKAKLEEQLRDMEELVPESISLSSGGCNNCDICTRKDGIPCRLPDKMRYSMDAFGFDLTAITKDLFDIDIQWCKDGLPEYFTLIHGLLTKNAVAEELWFLPNK
jgi:predicted metal-binding protein